MKTHGLFERLNCVLLALAPLACGDDRGVPRPQGFPGGPDVAELCTEICGRVATCEQVPDPPACEAACQEDLSTVSGDAARAYWTCVRRTVESAEAEDVDCDGWEDVCAASLAE